MLAELKSLHRRIEEGIAEIERLTGSPSPDIRALTTARVRLSQASAERSRFIASRIYPALENVRDESLRAALSQLLRDHIDKRQMSSEHVTRWSSRAVEADWAGYQRCSAQIRGMMRQRVAMERDVLYPPVGRFIG